MGVIRILIRYWGDILVLIRKKSDETVEISLDTYDYFMQLERQAQQYMTRIQQLLNSNHDCYNKIQALLIEKLGQDSDMTNQIMDILKGRC